MIDSNSQRLTQVRRHFQPLWNCLDRYLAANLNSGVLLALSGGPDSRSLLESVARWRPRTQGKIVVVSIDHSTRSESGPESEFIIKRARRLGFNAVKKNIFSLASKNEEHLRRLRYNLFAQLCEKHKLKTICTAHHADDDIEGFIMSLMGTGGGRLGASMGKLQKFKNLALVRPFLELSKNQLLACLTLSNCGDYARDTLDAQGVGARAFVRKFIAPQWSQNTPMLNNKIARQSRRLESILESLGQLVNPNITWESKSAKLVCSHNSNSAYIFCGLKKIMQKLAPQSEIRTLAAIAEKIYHRRAGLDQHPKCSNVSDLNTAAYQIPGANVFVRKGLIIVEKIDRCGTIN